MGTHLRACFVLIVLLAVTSGCRREVPAAAGESSPTAAAGRPASAETPATRVAAGTPARTPATTTPAGTSAAATPPAATPARVCGDDRDVLIAAYGEMDIPLTLQCADFTQTRRTELLEFKQIVQRPSYGWVLLRDPLLAGKDQGYGLDLMIQMYGASREINSSYRDPIHNKKVGGARRSRHLFGDAADVRNVTRSQEEWDRMWTAAEKARADYIEPLSGPCKLNCLHADWRNHEGAYGR